MSPEEYEKRCMMIANDIACDLVDDPNWSEEDACIVFVMAIKKLRKEVGCSDFTAIELKVLKKHINDGIAEHTYYIMNKEEKNDQRKA